MTEQLSIFDFLGEFATLPEEEMVWRIGQKLGIKFTQEVLPKDSYYFQSDYERFEYKRNGLKLTVGYLKDIEGKIFISVGYSCRTCGGGSPCYSIDEATRYLEKILERYG